MFVNVEVFVAALRITIKNSPSEYIYINLHRNEKVVAC